MPVASHSEAGRGDSRYGASEYYADLRYHLATATVITGTSCKIHKKLISAVADKPNDPIKEQISTAKYVTFMVDECTDVCTNGPKVHECSSSASSTPPSLQALFQRPSRLLESSLFLRNQPLTPTTSITTLLLFFHSCLKH